MTVHPHVVIAAHRDPAAASHTLRLLRRDPSTAHARIIVAVDQGADDPARWQALGHLADEVLLLDGHRGIDAFNHAMARVDGELALLLDDDAAPRPGAMPLALAAMRGDPRLGAVAFVPRVQPDGRSEWHWARPEPTRRWPLMGCASLIRLEAWRQVGGFEARYFLYANDTDLALRLLGAEWNVLMDPAIEADHRTATAFRRPDRWFGLATRNRVWNAKRHGGGHWPWIACLAWIEAHARAGARLGAHARAIAGFTSGVFTPAPPLPRGVPAARGHLLRLIHMRAAGPRQGPTP
jgi:N-acetylglucosaminyl-diphospho-decaprenol L-rhamnosyltransferase